MQKVYDKISNISKKISSFMLMLVFIVMCLSVFIQIILRTFFNTSVLAFEDVSKYSFSWLIFLGMIHAFEDDGHVAITALISALPKRAAIVVDYIQRIFVTIFLITMTIWGFIFSINNLSEISLQLRISAGIFYLIIPISCFLSLIPYIGFFLGLKSFGDVQHSTNTSM